MTNEQLEFLQHYGFFLEEEKWDVTNNSMYQNIITHNYTFKVVGESGVQILMDRLKACENTRQVIIEKTILDGRD